MNVLQSRMPCLPCALALAATLSLAAFDGRAQEREREPEHRKNKKHAKSIHLVPHSAVIGATVTNGLEGDARAELGSVADLIVGEDGSVTAVLVESGATLGLGGREISHPWDSVMIEQRHDDLALAIRMTQDRFAELPAFDRASMRETAEAAADKAVERAEGAAAEAMGERGEKRADDRPAPRPILISEWAELPIRTTSDEVGEPATFVIETRSGRIAFVDVPLGGLLGIGDEHVAVPWDAIELARDAEDSDELYLALGVGNETLENAPRIENMQKQLARREMRRKLYEHFQVEMPQWEREAAHAEKKAEEKAEKKKDRAEEQRARREGEGTGRDGAKKKRGPSGSSRRH